MMSTKARYHILPDRHEGSVMVFDAETGTIQHPACWQDLSALYHYLADRGRIDESQKLLAESMSGAKPITSLLTRMSQAAAGKKSRP